MKRAKKAAVEPQEKRITPDEETLRCWAELPEDVQKQALGYGYGLIANLKTKSA